MNQKESSIGQFSTKFHGSRWNTFLVMDENTEMVLCEMEVFQAVCFIAKPYFTKCAPEYAKTYLDCNNSGYAIIK